MSYKRINEVKIKFLFFNFFFLFYVTGASRFEHTVRLGTLRRAIKIKNSLDPTTSSLIDEKYDKKLKSIANSLRLN